MGKGIRRLLVVVVCVAVLAGCAFAGGQNPSGGNADRYDESRGTPWKDWFVRGVLTEDDEVRLEDDFYTAVNRDWLLWEGSGNSSSRSITSEREDQIADQLVGLVESGATGSEENAHDLQNVRNLYELYADWDGRDADGVEPLAELVDRVLEIRTIDELTAWLCSDDYRLTKSWYVDEEGRTGGLPLFALSLYTAQDAQDAAADPTMEELDGYSLDWDQAIEDAQEVQATEGYWVEIDPPAYDLSLLNVSDEEMMEQDLQNDVIDAAAQAEVARDVLVLLGFDEDEADELVWEAVELEDQLYLQSTDGSGSYEFLTHDQLAQAGAGGALLATVMDAYGYGDATACPVYDRAWLDALGATYTQDNLHALVAHTLVELASYGAPYLDGAASDAYYFDDGSTIRPELFNAVEESEDSDGVAPGAVETTPEQIEQEDKRFAMWAVEQDLPVSCSKVFVEHFYDDETSRQANEMVTRIVAQYEQMLAQEEWLSEQTRAAAIEKLQAMDTRVGYPQTWPDTSGLNVRTRSEGATLFSEVRAICAEDLQQELWLLRHPDEGEPWGNCIDVNAYYSVGENAIMINAGILGGDFWPEGASDEKLLGATGVTIGHEISHAFDSDAAYFDKNGEPNNWWTEEDLAAFEQRVERVQDCFAQIDPLGVGGYEGSQVCAEAIADMGGMKVVMQIARQDPDFDYDTFFRAYARSWACDQTLEDALDLFETDTHPLDRDRVNVPVREVDEFFETYGIVEGDGMWLDPAERVSVW